MQAWRFDWWFCRSEQILFCHLSLQRAYSSWLFSILLFQYNRDGKECKQVLCYVVCGLWDNEQKTCFRRAWTRSKYGRLSFLRSFAPRLPCKWVEKKARRALLVEFLLVPTAYFRSKMTHHSTRGPWFRPFSRFAPKSKFKTDLQNRLFRPQFEWVDDRWEIKRPNNESTTKLSCKLSKDRISKPSKS